MDRGVLQTVQVTEQSAGDATDRSMCQAFCCCSPPCFPRFVFIAGIFPPAEESAFMARLEIAQIPVLNDNYVYLVHEPDSGETAIIDPAEAEPVIRTLADKGWTPTHILNTHHHGDHVGANLALKEKYGLKIIGSASDEARIPGMDQGVSDGDVVSLGREVAHVIGVPGHTSGHIAFWFSDHDALFCGDTLFSLGCGRLFEGSPAQMWDSLSKLKRLPGDTQIYCAHEYTKANARFALALDPENIRLKQRAAWIDEMAEAGRPTVPSTLEQERTLNPFLRADDPKLAKKLGMGSNEAVDVFTEIRKRKDSF